jgi:hypothetical protein
VEKRSCERHEKWAMNFFLILQNTYIFYTTKIGESRIITNPSMTSCMTIHETMMWLYNIGIIIRQYLAMESKAMDKPMSTIMTK